jgi:hypothetical protein
MIKVRIWEAYGSGAMPGTNGKPHQYWNYEVNVMVKGSVKRAIKYAERLLHEQAEDKDGFSFVPVIYEMQVWKDGKLLLERD